MAWKTKNEKNVLWFLRTNFCFGLRTLIVLLRSPLRSEDETALTLNLSFGKAIARTERQAFTRFSLLVNRCSLDPTIKIFIEGLKSSWIRMMKQTGRKQRQ